MNLQIDRAGFWTGYGRQFGAPNENITNGLNAVLDRVAADAANWDNANQLAYALATFKWETANTFAPVYERGPESYFAKYDAGTEIGKNLGNTSPGDGFRFRGRGYVQITGRTNYTRIGKLIGVDLSNDPDGALQPDAAYKIASMGMKEGWFTGHRLSQHIATGAPPDFVNARRIINGLDHADDIAAIAVKFQSVLSSAVAGAASAGGD